MKILVTGGTGFIGSHLIDRLLESGDEVYALVRDPKRLGYLEGLDVRILPGDLFAIPALPAGLDAVVHLAGMTKTAKKAAYYSVNHLGTASVLEALHRQGSGARFLLLSSLSAAGPSVAGRPRREDDPPAPVTAYGRSKLLGERAALARLGERTVVVVRVGPVYGPRDKEYLELFRLLKRGILPRPGSRRRPVSHCYVKDLAKALALLARADVGPGGVFNVGDPEPYGIEDVGRTAARILGIHPREIVLPIPMARAIAWATGTLSLLTGTRTTINLDKMREYEKPSWVLDLGKIKERLGFEAAYDLQTGLKETIGWYLERGWL